jgi:transglutaminase/protease-like cytokinesis protein 3
MTKLLLNILFLLIFNVGNAQSNPTLELAKSMSKTTIKISDLNDIVEQKISNKEEIAKFFYYWISLNIEYDHETADKKESETTQEEIIDSENPLIAFNNRKAVCIGYSNLYKLFLDNFDIDCEIITGYAKTLKNLTLEIELDGEFRHAWNLIKLDNTWLLVDTTWAKLFEENISDYYFKTNPENFILGHYPENEKWQLTDKVVSVDEFNKLPYVHSFYFDTGFGELPKLTSDKEYYYIEFPKNQNKNWLTKLTYDSKNIINESIFPKYEEKENSNVFKFKKDKLPKNSILNVVVTYFDWEKQTKAEHNNIIKYQL